MYVFLGLVLVFVTAVLILVYEGAPLGLAVTVPAAVIAPASASVMFLRNLFRPGSDGQEPPQLPPMTALPSIGAPPEELPDTGDASRPKTETTGTES
ncbi:hypothetical protein ACWEVP_37330 [Amycolatopsis sp. NPDC003865]